MASGKLPSRDASLSDLPRGFFKQVNLSSYQASTQIKASKQEGYYKSRQGATITPVPLWAVEFQTIRRRSGETYQILPQQEQGQYVVSTARWASEVTGTGTEKEKWRNLKVSGPCSLDFMFAVVSSSWLVPFALAHRYLAYLPAEVSGDAKSADINMRHDFSASGNGLDAWTSIKKSSDSAIRNWTLQAQKEWARSKTEKSVDLVTERLNYQSTLSSQKPKSYRVVHTRSRSFYAAVLDPRSTTALGLPLSAARIRTTEGGKTVRMNDLSLAGVVCDNLLHSVLVSTLSEAYWMSGLFNSRPFNKLVMDKASGEPPGIYTIPVKVMDRLNLEFDPNHSVHVQISDVASTLEKRMKSTVRKYLEEEKHVDVNAVDDTDQSPEVPSTISSALMRRLGAEDALLELDRLVQRIL